MDGEDMYANFVKLHGAQLKASVVPEYYWYTVFKKLHNEIFDAGEVFLMAKIDESKLTVVVKDADGIKCLDKNHIYLIDHAWTFQASEAYRQLISIPQLLGRVARIIGLGSEASATANEVYNEMWKFMRTYSQVRVDEPPLTFWYLLDEFGCCIQHSPKPNFRAIPFYYHGDSNAYTLLFPIKDVEENTEVTIDYVEGARHHDARTCEALLVPWSGQSFMDENDGQREPDENYFLSGAHMESVPGILKSMAPSLSPVLKVYSEYSRVNQFLSASGFTMVNEEGEADILWLTRHFSEYSELNESRPNTFINQFPFERVITTKDLLCIACRRGGPPNWLPLTYNLLTELPAFIGCYERRESCNLDNLWICKPWNLARAIDTTVTNNLHYILRLPFSGPKIAQKYVERPVLFSRNDVGRVKFDVRYVILLESVQPLKVYAYKKFFLRFANKPFDLNDFWDYEKHFTVMNYQEDSPLYRMLSEEFIHEFERQYTDFKWTEVEEELLSAVKEAIGRACSVAPPRGIAHFPQSRALYAADLILQWQDQHSTKIQPILLEINYGPDCDRACEYYPQFYNDIFNLLFRNVIDETKFHVL